MKSIGMKLTIVVLCVILLGIIVTAGISMFIAGNVIQRESLEKVVYNTESEAYRMDSWLRSKMAVSSTLANVMEFREDDINALSGYLWENPRFADDTTIRPTFNAVLQEHDAVFEVFMGFINGRAQTGSGYIFDYFGERGPLHWTSYLRPWYQLALSDPTRAHVTTPYVDAQTGLWCVSIIRAVDGGRLGALGLDVFVADIEDIVFGLNIGAGGTVMLLGRTGDIYVHQNKEYTPIGTGQFHNIIEIADGNYASVWEAIQRGETAIRARDENGVYQYFSASHITSTGWYLVTAIPASVVNQPIVNVMLTIISLTIVIMVIAIILIQLTLKKIVIKPLKSLSNASKEIANGNLNVNIDRTNISKDEIGVLSDNFVAMQASILEKAEIEKAAHQSELAKGRAEAVAEAMREGVKYAKTIQSNLLPQGSDFEKAFSDYSVIWEPRDVVGGDIHWMKQFDEGTVLCVADCTGHGTPGALLTMLVVSTFESIILPGNCYDTANIIWELEQRLDEIFNVHERSNDDLKDGCDLAVLFIARDGSVTLSAGNTDVFICNGKESMRHRGQKLFIGEGKIMGKDEIKTVHIPANPDNKYYIASDGLYDQPSPEYKGSFGHRRFSNLILENHNEPQSVISGRIWEAFEAHRGEVAMVDDFQLITFKL